MDTPAADNPYAPPRDETPEAFDGVGGRRGSYRIAGDDLVIRDGARLPKICLKTGTRGRNERTQQFMFIPMWARLLFGALGTLAAKKATATFYLCDEAEHQRQLGTRIVLGSLGGGIVLAGLAMAGDMMPLAAVAVIGLLVGVVVGGRMGMGFRVVKVEDGEVFLRLQPAALSAFAERAKRPRKKRRKKRKQERA